MSVGAVTRLALVVLVMAVAEVLHAQPVSDTELIRRQTLQREELQERARKAPDVFTDAPDAAPDALQYPEETPCFTIDVVEWRGVESFPWILAEQSAIVGRCVGGRGLRAFQDYLARRLIERGFVTSRVLIPQQNLAAGVLAVQLLPGRIGKIRDQGQPAGFTSLTLPAAEGDLLNQRDLDQALENIRRLATQQGTQFDLVPGAEVGETDIVIRHPEERRWRGMLTLDDSGATETGKYQAGAVLVFDSPLHLYDVLTLALNNNANYGNERLGTGSSSISWSMPLGYWSFLLAANQSRYKQTVAGFGGDIEYGGRSYGVEAGIAYVPYRSSSAKGLLQVKLNRKVSRSRIDDTEIDVQYRNVVGYEANLAHRQYVGKGSFELGVGLRGSLPRHSSAPGFIVGAPGWDGRYRIKSASASLSIPLQVRQQQFRYYGSARLQKTNTLVPSSEYFSIGNRYTVRGFDGTSTLAAEEGWLLRNELAWTIPGSAHELFLALDRGRVYGPQADLLLGRALTGAALGLRGRVQRATYEITAGRPLKKPDGFDTKKLAVTAALTVEF